MTQPISRWNSDILPLLLQQQQISLFDIVKIASTEYIRGTRYIGDFLDFFIYQPDNYLSDRQNLLILNLIETLQNPQNFKEEEDSSVRYFDSFNINKHLSDQDYVALHEVYWLKEDLNNLFIQLDKLIQQFEENFIFGKNLIDNICIPTFYFQEHFSYFEATCLIAGYKEIYECRYLYEKDNSEFHLRYPRFKECFALLKSAKNVSFLPDQLILANELKEYLNSKNIHIPGFTDHQPIENQTPPIHPALDPNHPNHAPELLLALRAWEAKYLHDKYPHKGHTPAIESILKNEGVSSERLIARVSAITNPNKNIQ